MAQEEADVHCRIAVVHGFVIHQGEKATRRAGQPRLCVGRIHRPDEEVFRAEIAVADRLAVAFQPLNQRADGLAQIRMTLQDAKIKRLGTQLPEDRSVSEPLTKIGLASCPLMQLAKHQASEFRYSGLDSPRQQFSFPDTGRWRCVFHQQPVILPIDVENARDNPGRQDRGQRLHGLGFTENPFRIAQPQLPGAELRSGLFEHKPLPRRTYPQHQVGDTPAQRLHADNLFGYQTRLVQVIGGIVRRDFPHVFFVACRPPHAYPETEDDCFANHSGLTLAAPVYHGGLTLPTPLRATDRRRKWQRKPAVVEGLHMGLRQPSESCATAETDGAVAASPTHSYWWSRIPQLWADSLAALWRQTLWRRPILLVALAYTIGVLLTRWDCLSLPSCLLVGLALAVAPWVSAQHLSAAGRTVWLLGWCLLAGAAWYSVRTSAAHDDIRHDAPLEGRFVWLQVRLLDLHTVPPRHEPLQSWESSAHTTGLASVESIYLNGAWQRRSGTVRVSFDEVADWLAVGDRLQLRGELLALLPPGNPGEDAAGFSEYARGLSARLQVRKVTENCQRLESAHWYDLAAQLARCHHYFLRRLQELLPEDVSGLASALLLGEMSSLSPQSLRRYQHTGVIHVLAISGQHLVIVSAFVLWAGRFFSTTPRRLTWLMIALVWLYTLLTGARPATVRAAVTVSCWFLGLWLGRPAESVNWLCVAWLVIGWWQPLDWFTLGCQLSFLSSLVLHTLAPLLLRWSNAFFSDPWHGLERPSSPRWIARTVIAWLRDGVLVSVAIWLTLAPWLAACIATVAIASVWLTPVIVPLTAIALLAGMALLLCAGVPGLSAVLSWLVAWPLRTTEYLLVWAEHVPLAYFFTPGPSSWWLAGFYLIVLAWLLLPGVTRAWRSVVGLLAAWSVFGWLVTFVPENSVACQVTFLDVGHGGCVVVETSDGRTWLYDAGSLQGPDVAERIIAPYLWHRNKRRIDAILLSHGDLDHYNGLPQLAERFRVGAVYVTPTFWEKGGSATQYVWQTLKRAGVPVYQLDNRMGWLRLAPAETTPASDRAVSLPQGQSLTVAVLHPPPDGPTGPENARSLVLLLRFGPWQILLTGDLEEPGLSQVLPRLPNAVDVLLAPHHGSPRSNTAVVAQTCRPGLVVVPCDRRRSQRAAVYQAVGATVWETWREGAVRITIDQRGLLAETYRSGKRWAR